MINFPVCERAEDACADDDRTDEVHDSVEMTDKDSSLSTFLSLGGETDVTGVSGVVRFACKSDLHFASSYISI